MEKKTFLLLNFIIRLVLIFIASILDSMATTSFRYTDKDYGVFSDAATKVYNGGSPFERQTYRYTPLVAYLCLVNNIIHPLAAKVIFAIFDILMGFLLWEIVESQNVKKNSSTLALVSIWIVNPVIINLSTRGSNDNMIAVILFTALYFYLKKQYIIAGFFYGLSVHFKIYPIIYSFVLYLNIDLRTDLIIRG